MAKYIHVPQLGMFTYALDECEDCLVLDAYLRIKNSGKFNNARHIKIFEYYHLQEGGMLNDNILMQLNSSLRQLGYKSLQFVNGHTTNFAALRGQDKVLRREAILEHIHSLTSVQRADFIARKEEEAARLPERSSDMPHRPPAPTGGLSREEMERRRTAVRNSQRAENSLGASAVAVVPPSTDLSTLVTLEPEREFVPESTIQDNIVGLMTEMNDLRTEVASLKTMLQTIFKNV